MTAPHRSIPVTVEGQGRGHVVSEPCKAKQQRALRFKHFRRLNDAAYLGLRQEQEHK